MGFLGYMQLPETFSSIEIVRTDAPIAFTKSFDRITRVRHWGLATRPLIEAN